MRCFRSERREKKDAGRANNVDVKPVRLSRALLRRSVQEVQMQMTVKMHSGVCRCLL